MKIDLTRSTCRQTVPSTSTLGFGFAFMFLFLAVCFSRRIKVWVGSPRPVIIGFYPQYVITRSRVVDYSIETPGSEQKVKMTRS